MAMYRLFGSNNKCYLTVVTCYLIPSNKCYSTQLTICYFILILLTIYYLRQVTTRRIKNIYFHSKHLFVAASFYFGITFDKSGFCAVFILKKSIIIVSSHHKKKRKSWEENITIINIECVKKNYYKMLTLTYINFFHKFISEYSAGFSIILSHINSSQLKCIHYTLCRNSRRGFRYIPSIELPVGLNYYKL